MGVEDVNAGLENMKQLLSGAPYETTIDVLPPIDVGGIDALRAVLTAHCGIIKDSARPGVQAIQGCAVYAKDELIAVTGDDPNEIHPLLADVFANLGQMSVKATEAGSAIGFMDESLQEALGCLLGLEKALGAYRQGRIAAETYITEAKGAAGAAAASADEYQRNI